MASTTARLSSLSWMSSRPGGWGHGWCSCRLLLDQVPCPRPAGPEAVRWTRGCRPRRPSSMRSSMPRASGRAQRACTCGLDGSCTVVSDEQRLVRGARSPDRRARPCTRASSHQRRSANQRSGAPGDKAVRRGAPVDRPPVVEVAEEQRVDGPVERGQGESRAGPSRARPGSSSICRRRPCRASSTPAGLLAVTEERGDSAPRAMPTRLSRLRIADPVERGVRGALGDRGPVRRTWRCPDTVGAARPSRSAAAARRRSPSTGRQASGSRASRSRRRGSRGWWPTASAISARELT